MVMRYPKMVVCFFLVFAFILVAAPIQSDRRALPDISGTWNSSSGDVYRITRQGSDFTWLNTRTNQKMSGKIEGEKLVVTWSDRTGKRSITGVISEFDSRGVPNKIVWSNRMIFYRQTQPQKVSPIKGWCCHEGNIFPAHPEECKERGGHFFRTREEAEEHCQREHPQPPEPMEPPEPPEPGEPEEGWCCHEGNIFPAHPEECERRGGHFFRTREEAEEHCRREHPQPPEPMEPPEPGEPEEGWCCHEGNIFPAHPEECEERGGHFFRTREEAEEHCRREHPQPPEPMEPPEPPEPGEEEYPLRTLVTDELYLPRPEYTLFSVMAMPLEYFEAREAQIETDEGVKNIKYISVSPEELRNQDLDPPAVEYPGEVGVFEGDILFNAVEMKEGPVYPGAEGENMSGGPVMMPFFLFSGGISDWKRLWPKRVVPYVIAPLAQQYDGGQILTAMSYWQKAGFTFRPRQPEDGSRYMYFMKISSWYSGSSDGIGMDPAGGPRSIRIGYHVSTGLIAHEIGHGLGLFHEHSRIDRDNYVDIFWNNVKSDHYHDYCQYKVTTPTSYCAKMDRGGKDIGPYDFSSIMHYGSYTFGKISVKKVFLNGIKCILWPFDSDCYKSKSYVMRTMQKKDGSTIVANDSSPSTLDINALKELYKYADKCGGMLESKYGTVKFGGVNTFNHEVNSCTNRSYQAYTKDYRTLALTIDGINADIPAKDFRVRLTTPTVNGGVQIINAYNPAGNKKRLTIYKNLLPGPHSLKISNWLYQKIKYKMSFKFTTTPVPMDMFDKANKGNSISTPVDLGTLPSSPLYTKTVTNVTIHHAGDIDYYTFLLPPLPTWAIEQYCDKPKGPNGAKIFPGRFIIQVERQDLHRTLRTVVYQYDSSGKVIADPLKAFRPWGWETREQVIKCPYKHFKNRRVIFSVEDCSDIAGYGKTDSAGHCSKAKRHYYSLRISFGFTYEEKIPPKLPHLDVLPPLLKHGPIPRYLTPMAVEFIINQGQYFMQSLPDELKTGYGFDQILDPKNEQTADTLNVGNLNLLYKQHFNSQNQ